MSDPARREFIAGLRALAGFYEARPEAYYDGMRVTLSMYAAGRRAHGALADMAAAFAEEDQRGSSATASGHGRNVRETTTTMPCGGCPAVRAALARDFGAKVRLELFVPSAECRRWP